MFSVTYQVRGSLQPSPGAPCLPHSVMICDRLCQFGTKTGTSLPSRERLTQAPLQWITAKNRCRTAPKEILRQVEPGVSFGITWIRAGLEGRSYTTFLSTSAEFFEPNAMQLHTACSIVFFLPGSGT